MIIKGGSRGGPKQLARHLLRTDTNERVQILESDYGALELKDVLSDMQLLTAGTKGQKGLYHANIDPHGDYAMSPEQWSRCIEVLEEELGYSGQPRVVVLHQKKGREHIHVVWARTDIDRMTLRSDSRNYAAHERASLRLEREFGHEITPGCHAKRDPSKPRPRAAFNHATWQQMERTGVDPRDRQAQITRLYHAADNGRTFQNALKQEGYVLAIGQRRAFVVIDPFGDIHSVSRQVTDTRARDIRAKLADLDPASLPLAEEAKALVRAFSEASRKHHPQPSPAKPAPPERDPYSEARQRLAAEHDALLDIQARALARAERNWQQLKERETQAFDASLAQRRHAERQADGRRSRRRFPFMGNAPKPPAPAPRPPRRAIWRFNPGRAQDYAGEQQAREAARDRRDAALRAERQARLEAVIEAKRQAMLERQASQLRDLETRQAEELARLEREEARYRELRRERQARERERTRRELTRDGPGRGRDR